MTKEETLTIYGIFARYFSSNYQKDQPYGLGKEGYDFIVLGYEIGASGIFDDRKK